MQDVSFEKLSFVVSKNAIMFIGLFDLKWAFKFCGQFAILVEKVVDMH